MTPRSTSAEPAALGWPADERNPMDDVEAVSRETSTGLGWPEYQE